MKRTSSGFSLIEVVLALSIFSLAVLGLLGLLGPLLITVGEQLDTGDVVSVPDQLHAYWQETLPLDPALATALVNASADNPVQLISWCAAGRRHLGDRTAFADAVLGNLADSAVYGLQVVPVEASSDDPAWMSGDPLAPVPVAPAFRRLRIEVTALRPPAPDEAMAAYEARLFRSLPILTFFSVAPLR